MKIALIGYGKMGKAIEQIAKERGHDIVAIIDIDNQDEFGSAAFASADVAIEFTTPATAVGNYRRCFEAGVKVVSGSTGWVAEQGDDVRRLCTEGGYTLFWSSNFSLGVALFSALNRYLARLMNAFPTYDVCLTETHHIHKKDAPSGTAITLAEDIVERLDRKTAWTRGLLLTQDGAKEETYHCEDEQLPIHSIRMGEVPGIHSICYDSAADSLTITHDAKGRAGFALGAVLAAEYTASHSGWLGMADLFPFLND